MSVTLESGGIFLQKQLVCFFLRTGFFQYFCGNCSHNRIYFSCVYWTEGYTAHAGDALGFVRGFAVVQRNCAGRTFLCTQTAGSAGVLYVWNHAGVRMFRGAVTGNFRDREIAGNCLLKNLPAKCGEILTVSTVWSSGSVLVNNGMLCDC